MAETYGPRKPYGHGLPKKKGRNLSPRHKEAEQEVLDALIREAQGRMSRGELRKMEYVSDVEREAPPLPSPAPLEPPGERNQLTLPPPPARAQNASPGPSGATPDGTPAMTDAERKARLELLEEKIKLGKPRYSDVDFD